MSSSDRQLLLEQKRKRLQELKERRSKAASIDVTSPNLAISEAEPVRTKVDFAVQVDLIRPQSPTLSPVAGTHTQKLDVDSNFKAASRPVVRFDKTVQTNFEDLVDLSLGGHTDSKKEPDVVIEPEIVPLPPTEQQIEYIKENKVESSISEFLSGSGFRFSDLRLGKKHEEAPVSDIVAPFHVTKTLKDFLDRPIVAMASTPDHPDVFLVAYGKSEPVSRSKRKPRVSSAGLAVLFNKSGDTIVPEFFLECTSSICTIIFDRTNPFKVFAGLENGRIVMWDLFKVEPTQVSVLPTLQTTTVGANSHKSPHKFIHHIAPIVLLVSLDTEMSVGSGVLSICREGVVNLWSPNLLVYPKIASIRLKDTDMGSRIPFRVTDALLKSAVFRVPGAGGHQNPPEYNFLDSVVLAAENGRIYRLANSKETAYIGSIFGNSPNTESSKEGRFLEEPFDTEDAGPSARGVSSVIELKYNSTITLIVSAHRDWSLRIWDSESGVLRHVSHTATLISRILPRPGHGSQFITVGCVRPPSKGLFVEFWDIKSKLWGPISSVPMQDKHSGTASFSQDGSEMILAYGDGEIDVFSVEESLLDFQVKARSQLSADEGMDKLLSAL